MLRCGYGLNGPMVKWFKCPIAKKKTASFTFETVSLKILSLELPISAWRPPRHTSSGRNQPWPYLSSYHRHNSKDCRMI
jgi:hypothetical protein